MEDAVEGLEEVTASPSPSVTDPAEAAARSRRGRAEEQSTESPWIPAETASPETETETPRSRQHDNWSSSVWRGVWSGRRQLGRSLLSLRSGVSQLSPSRGGKWPSLSGRWPSLSGGVTVWIICGILGWVLLQTVVVEMSMSATQRRSLHVGRKLGNAFDSNSPESAEFADEMAKAFSEWKLIQEQLPDQYANFSQFLVQEKMKETHLRKRLSRLSKKSLSLMSDIVVPPAQAPPKYSREEDQELKWSYLSMEKAWPYVGSERYLDRFRLNSRAYFNSLAVFPHANRTRLHGLVGIFPNGTRAWRPSAMPPPMKDLSKDDQAEALRDGGFYLNLSNALPLDRDVPDLREEFCQEEVYNLEEFEDASVVITFYNEHASTLLRSVHSVLNLTPPPLLREIILVDDHSNNTANTPGGYIYEYIKLLPKVKLMRLPERRGLVQARLAGAKIAKAPVIVVLDSHIEVNPFWLEPQLKRLKESPRSVVFPQIMALDSETLEWRTDSGIGCFLSFKWIMQERPYFSKMTSAAPVVSASMAGGLFAVRREWFFESGAYDEEFSMWGAENVEMAFRVWMCGGRVECTPCAHTYHIYRHGGSGYKSPHDFIRKNRIRTGRLWLDEYWQIARYFHDERDLDQGSYDKMLELRERLQCKDFQWFLDNIDPSREGINMDEYGAIGEFRNLGKGGNKCLDNLGHRLAGEEFGVYGCHGGLGSQGWFEYKESRRIRNMANENTCISHNFKLTYCDRNAEDNHFRAVPEKKWIAWAKTAEALKNDNFTMDYECLGVDHAASKLVWKECSDADQDITWEFKLFEKDPNFKRLEISDARREILRKRHETQEGASS